MYRVNLIMSSYVRCLTLLCCATLLFFLTIQGQVKPKTIDDFSTLVKENSKTTYSDLIDLIFPETGGGTRKSVPLDNIFDDYKGKIYEGDLEPDSVEAVWINNNGRKQ